MTRVARKARTVARAHAASSFGGRIPFLDCKNTVKSDFDSVELRISRSRIFPRMTVVENLEMGAFARADRDAIAPDLERVLTLFPRLRERIAQKASLERSTARLSPWVAEASRARPLGRERRAVALDSSKPRPGHLNSGAFATATRPAGRRSRPALSRIPRSGA
jgi:hypothetical protein